MSNLIGANNLGRDDVTQGNFKLYIEQFRQFVEDSIGTDSETVLSSLIYDNTLSGLTSTNAKSAIDELALNLGGGGDSTFIKPNKGVLFTKETPHSVSIPLGFKVGVDGILVEVNTKYTLDLDTSDLVGSTKTNGKDYFVYAKADETFYISEDNSITSGTLIGGFHYGLTPEDEVLPIGAKKTEADMVTSRGIKSYSMWDLEWKPSNLRPQGMVLVENRKWVPIYPADEDIAIRGYPSCYALDGVTPAKLAGGVEINGRKFPKIPLSRGGDGTITYGSLTQYDATEIAATLGCELPSYAEYQSLAYGVVEGKSLQMLGYTVGTGVIQHYPELESKWGVEMAVGVQFMWGREILNGYGTTDFAHRLTVTDGRGSLYATSNSPVGAIFSSYELGTSIYDVPGSCYLFLNYYVWATNWQNGFTAVCDHLNLGK